jgi:hypothetical protein
MIVPVDETGNDHHSGKIDDLGSTLRSPPLQIRHRADRGDAIIVDPDPAVANNFSRRIDSNQVTVSEK